MSTSTTKILLAATLMSAGTISMLGCAKIIGADFNRPVIDNVGGGGGSSVDASAVEASSSAEASSSSSSGTGGEMPELCDLGSVAPGGENLNINVAAHEMGGDNGGTSDQKFYSYREGFAAPTNGYTFNLGSYELFRQGAVGRVPVFQCSVPGSYYVGTKTELGEGSCQCLGYAVKTNTGKPLLKIIGDATQKSAYITDSDKCSQYGYHPDKGPGCVATDLVSAAK